MQINDFIDVCPYKYQVSIYHYHLKKKIINKLTNVKKLYFRNVSVFLLVSHGRQSKYFFKEIIFRSLYSRYFLTFFSLHLISNTRNLLYKIPNLVASSNKIYKCNFYSFIVLFCCFYVCYCFNKFVFLTVRIVLENSDRNCKCDIFKKSSYIKGC